jgi:hypothetical protein
MIAVAKFQTPHRFLRQDPITETNQLVMFLIARRNRLTPFATT